MIVHRGLSELPELKNAVLSIGAFDGVHHGHRKIIDFINEKARSIDGVSVVLTFHPHPRKIVYPKDQSLQLLNTMEEKIDLLEKCGLDHLIIAPFTVEFSQIDPMEYVANVLGDTIKPNHIVIGYDHRFGFNRQGDINLLKKCAELGMFELTEIPEQEIDELKVSSSKIRNHILAGEIDKANKKLAEPFRLTGTVQQGRKEARQLGYPTANLKISDIDKILPAKGIYACRCHINGSSYRSMLYHGDNKTLHSEGHRSVEVHLMEEFHGDLYDQVIKVDLLHFIRHDNVFSSRRELQFNIETDERVANSYFNRIEAEYKVAVVILNYNGRSFLEEYLESHKKSFNGDLGLFVIDNSSQDDSVEYLKHVHPNVNLVQLENNHGFAQGYNLGLEQINAQYFVIINSDVKVLENWLDPIIEHLDEHSDVAAVQPKILDVRQTNKFEYAGASGGMIDTLGYPFCRGRVFETVEKDEHQYEDQSEVFWVSGAAMVVRSDVFSVYGGFDKDFFAHMEEIDFCWRIKNSGLKLKCLPSTYVYHLGGGTLNYNSHHKTFLNFRNNWWMMLKNEHLSRIWWVSMMRLILDLVASARFLLMGQPGGLWAIWRALFAVVKSLPGISQKRTKLTWFRKRKGAEVRQLTGRYGFILPIRYYLQGKRTFSDLIDS